MRSLIILCIILSGESISQAQLNFEGNPLTENTEYKAEESHLSRQNVRQDYERFEVSDGRIFSVTKVPFTPSPIDNVATSFKHHSRISDEAKMSEEKKAESPTIKGSALNNDQVDSMKDFNSTSNAYESTSASEPNETKPLEPSLSSPKASALPKNVQSPAKARQLHEHPVESQRLLPHQSAISQKSYQIYGQSQSYDSPNESLEAKNSEAYYSIPASSGGASYQALNEFLNSRTPEESQLALQNYLAIREQATRGAYKIGSVNGIQMSQKVEHVNVPIDEGIKHTTGRIFNGHPNDEYLAYHQPQESPNTQRLQVLSSEVTSKLVQDRMDQPIYSQAQRNPIPRGNSNLDLQIRPNVVAIAGPKRQWSRYRGHMGGHIRGRPWAQSRIGGGPFGYHHKGPIYNGPPPQPGPPTGTHAGLHSNKWKTPVEVIYTRPPGFGHGPSQTSNPPVPYEDASHWFPDADEPPPQKDLYYSQLYAQSYDPHYYNYIAKTGKIKPWLYGKLGKHEEKSIWWELFAGFKKHGMKNIMNPMFLLGMTIPTLTIMLTALVQKRSLGRADNTGYINEELIDQYVQKLQRDIKCYEQLIKDGESSEDDKCW